VFSSKFTLAREWIKAIAVSGLYSKSTSIFHNHYCLSSFFSVHGCQGIENSSLPDAENFLASQMSMNSEPFQRTDIVLGSTNPLFYTILALRFAIYNRREKKKKKSVRRIEILGL
jgi:hypothetical protein